MMTQYKTIGPFFQNVNYTIDSMKALISIDCDM